jgi:predicted DNA-binding protein (MmcQ/YjbR family)
MKNQQQIESYILGLPDVWIDFPFGENVSVYKVGHAKTDNSNMFALINNGSQPLRLSLKCDPLLAEKLRQDYETVLPGVNLNKKHWNTIICTGQVPEDELKSLIIISHQLVSKEVAD